MLKNQSGYLAWQCNCIGSWGVDSRRRSIKMHSKCCCAKTIYLLREKNIFH